MHKLLGLCVEADRFFLSVSPETGWFCKITTNYEIWSRMTMLKSHKIDLCPHLA